jgi:protein-tyrosine phosphatase
MRQVSPHRLFLGNALDARDLRRLNELEIAAVIDLALEEKPAVLGRELVYCRFPLVDGAGNSPVILRAAVEMVVSLMKSQTLTLVACGAGMSRSPAVAALALARISGQSPEANLAAIVAGQPHDVSPLFWDELVRALE